MDPRTTDERTAAADAREEALTERESDVDELFAAAELRDARTHIRDLEADHRDMAAELDASRSGVDDAPATAARSLAKRDRRHSEHDRLDAEVDRYAFADREPAGSEARASGSAATLSRTGTSSDIDQSVDQALERGQVVVAARRQVGPDDLASRRLRKGNCP